MGSDETLEWPLSLLIETELPELEGEAAPGGATSAKQKGAVLKSTERIKSELMTLELVFTIYFIKIYSPCSNSNKHHPFCQHLYSWLIKMKDIQPRRAQITLIYPIFSKPWPSLSATTDAASCDTSATLWKDELEKTRPT